MSSEEKTLVLIHLGMSHTPIAPHRPGSFVCGYVSGNQAEAELYLNQCKMEKRNALIQNAFLVQTGIEFVPTIQTDPEGRPLRGPNGQPLTVPGQMDVKQGFAMLPLTKMDPTTGCDWSVEAVLWVYPRGTMIQDLEGYFENTRSNLLHSRTGLTLHPAGPGGLHQ